MLRQQHLREQRRPGMALLQTRSVLRQVLDLEMLGLEPRQLREQILGQMRQRQLQNPGQFRDLLQPRRQLQNPCQLRDLLQQRRQLQNPCQFRDLMRQMAQLRVPVEQMRQLRRQLREQLRQLRDLEMLQRWEQMWQPVLGPSLG